MALLKLWNAILGRTAEETSSPAKSSPSSSPGSNAAAGPAKPQGDVRAETPQEKKPRADRPHADKPHLNKPLAVTKRGLFGGTSVHAPLLKKLRGFTAESILEISVGDGSRAVQVIDQLRSTAAKSGGADPAAIKLRYAAIDQFEMGGGSHTLMQFHQTIRSGGIRPQVFPETVPRGLMRVAHTLGSMDLILISAQPQQWQIPEIKSLLARITHQQSRIFFQTDGVWNEFPLAELGSAPVFRRAG